MNSRLRVLVAAALAISTVTGRDAVAAEPAITTYGERNPEAPAELDLFSFLVGKWSGTGRTRLEDGNHVDWQGATWIGRYILNGMAIADELHAPGPDGKLHLGITLRQFDTEHDAWIVEFLNIPNSFLRRQVNPNAGSLSREADSVVVISEDDQLRIRERYRLVDQNHFTYTTDLSRDAGRSWDPVWLEMTMTRVE
jgi:hypothetical protein